jgi:hypothetical protein
MSDIDAKITKDNVRARLSTKYDRSQGTFIAFQGEIIGRLVHYGKRVGLAQTATRDVAASRILWNGTKIDEEGANGRAVLDKVAGALARAMKARGEKSLAPLSEAAASLAVPAPEADEPAGPVM